MKRSRDSENSDVSCSQGQEEEGGSELDGIGDSQGQEGEVGSEASSMPSPLTPVIKNEVNTVSLKKLVLGSRKPRSGEEDNFLEEEPKPRKIPKRKLWEAEGGEKADEQDTILNHQTELKAVSDELSKSLILLCGYRGMDDFNPSQNAFENLLSTISSWRFQKGMPSFNENVKILKFSDHMKTYSLRLEEKYQALQSSWDSLVAKVGKTSLVDSMNSSISLLYNELSNVHEVLRCKLEGKNQILDQLGEIIQKGPKEADFKEKILALSHCTENIEIETQFFRYFLLSLKGSLNLDVLDTTLCEQIWEMEGEFKKLSFQAQAIRNLMDKTDLTGDYQKILSEASSFLDKNQKTRIKDFKSLDFSNREVALYAIKAKVTVLKICLELESPSDKNYQVPLGALIEKFNFLLKFFEFQQEIYQKKTHYLEQHKYQVVFDVERLHRTFKVIHSFMEEAEFLGEFVDEAWDLEEDGKFCFEIINEFKKEILAFKVDSDSLVERIFLFGNEQIKETFVDLEKKLSCLKILTSKKEEVIPSKEMISARNQEFFGPGAVLSLRDSGRFAGRKKEMSPEKVVLPEMRQCISEAKTIFEVVKKYEENFNILCKYRSIYFDQDFFWLKPNTKIKKFLDQTHEVAEKRIEGFQKINTLLKQKMSEGSLVAHCSILDTEISSCLESLDAFYKLVQTFLLGKDEVHERSESLRKINFQLFNEVKRVEGCEETQLSQYQKAIVEFSEKVPQIEDFILVAGNISNGSQELQTALSALERQKVDIVNLCNGYNLLTKLPKIPPELVNLVEKQIILKNRPMLEEGEKNLENLNQAITNLMDQIPSFDRVEGESLLAELKHAQNQLKLEHTCSGIESKLSNEHQTFFKQVYFPAEEKEFDIIQNDLLILERLLNTYIGSAKEFEETSRPGLC